MSQSKGQLERDCTEKCKSAQHGHELCSVISKRAVTDAELCAYIRWKCCACGQVFDNMGRSALHFAASCGRTQLVKWLICCRGAQINAKDCESGYTALHRSVFYGKINTAVNLVQLGANMNIVDHNDLTALEHAMKDKKRLSEFSLLSDCQVYVWGTNINYTLGTGSQHARQLPDLHDVFHKKYTNVSVKHICLNKFHCMLLSRDGRVFSCGHGQGGRLGVNSESTMLIPQEVKFSGSSPTFACAQVSIARDHSLFLSESGQVFSCGLNTFHVLGIKPSPQQLLVPKPLTDFRAEIKGICTGRFHSVAWGPKSVYTWGLHAGQLGHSRSNNQTFVTPKFVASLPIHETIEIISVAASDGATVVATNKGDVFVLHEYQCRRIAFKQPNIDRVIVVGGHLCSKLSSSLLVEKGGKELKVLVLLTTGNLHIWQESYPQLSRCIYTLNRPIIVKDATMSHSELFFVTEDGEAFKGELRTRKKKPQEPNNTNVHKSAFHEFLDKDDCQMVKITKFPHVHRAVRIQCDLKGRNFGVLQNDPRSLLLDVPEVSSSTISEDLANLLNNSDELDAVHDVVFKVSGHVFPVHRYILALKSEPLFSLIESHQPSDFIQLENINPFIFKQLLLYIYTETCDLITPGNCPKELQSLCCKENLKQGKASEFSDLMDVDENVSAFEIYNKKQKCKPKMKEKEGPDVDPVKLLRHAAKRFGVKELLKQLENVYYLHGCIQQKCAKVNGGRHITFDRSSFPDLYDVEIKSKNGVLFPVHKCILAARLEYFNNLFALRWNENSVKTLISLPISHRVLDQIIDFLYTDEAKELKTSEDVDHISNILVVCDQLFIDRLKQICEVALSGLISLKNAAQVLQFSTIYNSKQLKRCTMEFICLNLAAVLESKILEYVDSEILDELTEYYCSWNYLLCKRVITPYCDAPDDETVRSVSDSHPVKMDEFDQENWGKKSTPKLGSKRKMRPRKTSNSESLRQRTASETCDNSSLSEPCEEVVKEDKKAPDEKWVMILTERQKHQKVVQARLRAIAFAKEELEAENPLGGNFTKLVSPPKAIPKHNGSFRAPNSPVTSPVLSRSTPSSSFIDQARSPPPIYDIPILKAPKLSQKQRKKLASTSSQDGDEIARKSASNPEKGADRGSNGEKESSSFADVMKGRGDFPSLSPKNPWQKIELPSPTGSPESRQNFVDIIADEKKLKENWTKMISRPLIYTQMEDKAIKDLERFYNVNEVSDEHITIHKVKKGAVSVPLWVHSNTKH